MWQRTKQKARQDIRGSGHKIKQEVKNLWCVPHHIRHYQIFHISSAKAREVRSHWELRQNAVYYLLRMSQKLTLHIDFPSHEMACVMSLFTLPVSMLVVKNSRRLGHFLRVCSLLVFFCKITSLLSVSQIKWGLHRIQLKASTEQKKKHTMTEDTTSSRIRSTKHFFSFTCKQN